jgi:phosphoserine aminotransferase
LAPPIVARKNTRQIVFLLRFVTEGNDHRPHHIHTKSKNRRRSSARAFFFPNMLLNLGPAGATLYIVKDEILGKSTAPFMPTYLDLKQQIDKESMLNTPPVFSVYVAMLNLRNLIAHGGVKDMEARNNAKSALLYAEIDRNSQFKGAVEREDRSHMNITFLLEDEARASIFDAMWKEAGIVGLPGHRSVGGYRASMYNALPIESVQVLVDVMKEFERKA